MGWGAEEQAQEAYLVGRRWLVTSLECRLRPQIRAGGLGGLREGLSRGVLGRCLLWGKRSGCARPSRSHSSKFVQAEGQPQLGVLAPGPARVDKPGRTSRGCRAQPMQVEAQLRPSQPYGRQKDLGGATPASRIVTWGGGHCPQKVS